MTTALSLTDNCIPRPVRLVVVRPAPRREPPFDDELASRHLVAVGRFDQPLPFASDVRQGDFTVVRPPDRGGLADPAVWARRLLLGIIEAAADRRPFQQLAPMLSPSVARALGAELTGALRRNARHWTHAATIGSLRSCEPCAGVAELSATVQVGGRTRAIALRAQAHHGAWRCTRIQFG